MIEAQEVDKEGYLESLSPRDKERFEKEYKTNFGNIDQEAIETDLRQKFDERARPHNRLVKGCAGAFHPKTGSMGTDSEFYFSSVTPLAPFDGIEEPIVDVMLEKHEHNAAYLCAICCEARNGAKDWVDNINKAHEIIERNRPYFEEQFGATTRGIREIQYVTLLDADEAMGVDVSTLKRNCDPDNYALWEMDKDDWWISNKGGKICHPQLKDAISKKIDVVIENPLHYSVGTHPVIPLEKISYKIMKEQLTFDDDNPDEFSTGMFETHYREGLQIKCEDNAKDQIVDREMERLLEAGINMGYLSQDDLDDSTRDYRLVYTGPRKPDHAEKGVETQYFRNMPEYVGSVQAFEETKDSFDPETTIGDYN